MHVTMADPNTSDPPLSFSSGIPEKYILKLLCNINPILQAQPHIL